MLGSLQGLQQPVQQQQQGQGPQGQLGQQQQQQPIPPPPPSNGQDFTLSSVLHYLQTEWRRYERDRNEWEIERAEMRARIALLEGERRSFDNVKLDLMRRIKMLEYALRVERTKQLAPPTSNQSTKLASLHVAGGSKDDAHSQKDDSGGSSPRSEDSPLPDARIPNGSALNGPVRTGSWGTGHWSNIQPSIAAASLGKPPLGRDPKSRARSRDYLKQCLQEISYLTSPQAMNPLPNRPILNPSTGSLALPNVPSFEQIPFRPRKVMPEPGKEFPVLNPIGSSSSPVPPGHQLPSLDRTNHPPIQQQQQQPTLPQLPPQQQQPPSSTNGERKEDSEAEPRSVDAHESGEEPKHTREFPNGLGSDLSDLDPDDEFKDGVYTEDGPVSDGEGLKQWKAKKTLRNHLDAVRAIAFHPTELCLATGGDDCTVKIWRMDVGSLASSSARPTTEVEPQLTLRGHLAAVTKLVHSPSKGLLYSASLDFSIRIWALPSPSHTTYAPYDETRSRGELVGHTDAVWDLALVRDESTLISCGAEGTVKVWDVSGPSGGGSLKLTWGWHGVHTSDDVAEDIEAPGATAVEAIKTDLKKVAVAYQNSVVKIFEIETGREVQRLESDISYDGTPATQINRIVSHPTMSLLVTAHEDRHIRIFDITTGQCTHSMLAHLDGVTSLSIDPAGFTLVSGSHDCSVRFWDLLGAKSCIQELTSHREKGKEGVLDVEFHPSLPFMVSGGADGVVKLYASS